MILSVNSLSLVSIQNRGAMMMEFRLSASMISCLICLRQINIDFHNTNFRLMGDYENFDAVTIAVGQGGVSSLK